jgi:hypothetical protein
LPQSELRLQLAQTVWRAGRDPELVELVFGDQIEWHPVDQATIQVTITADRYSSPKPVDVRHERRRPQHQAECGVVPGVSVAQINGLELR